MTNTIFQQLLSRRPSLGFGGFYSHTDQRFPQQRQALADAKTDVGRAANWLSSGGPVTGCVDAIADAAGVTFGAMVLALDYFGRSITRNDRGATV